MTALETLTAVFEMARKEDAAYGAELTRTYGEADARAARFDRSRFQRTPRLAGFRRRKIDADNALRRAITAARGQEDERILQAERYLWATITGGDE